ncbi:hypothetical protein HAX54_029864, partial [Datura stramonium]|nr:hypothetical protein [Datura stramonium]
AMVGALNACVPNFEMFHSTPWRDGGRGAQEHSILRRKFPKIPSVMDRAGR